MAVQPDRRPWERLVAENGWQQTERHRVGIWTLTASADDINPQSFNVRCDRPGFPKGAAVFKTPHDGWKIYDGDASYSTWGSPHECLEWWSARRRSS